MGLCFILLSFAALCSGIDCAVKPTVTEVHLKDMNAVTFLKLLKANNPFVVKGALFPPSIWDHLFSIYSEDNVELWNQTNDYWNIFKQEHDQRGDHLCPCAEMSSSIVAESKEIDPKADFQVVERAVRPFSRVDKEIIQPLLHHSYNSWMGNLTRINLFNTVFSSRGDTRGVFHYHNYEAFCNFIKVGSGTTIYLARPSCFGALNATIRKAKATVVNAFGWSEQELNSVLEYKVQVNDVFHFPAGWFHRVDHRGEYLNVGHSFYVADVLQGRLDEILPHLSLADSDYFSRWTNMHWAWWVIAPPQYFFEMARDYLVKKLF